MSQIYLIQFISFFFFSLDDPYLSALKNVKPDYEDGVLKYIEDLKTIQSTSEEFLTEPGDEEDDKILKRIVSDAKAALKTLQESCKSISINSNIDNIVNCAPKVFSTYKLDKVGDKQCHV